MSYHIRYDSNDGIILDALIHECNNAKAIVLMLHGINSDKNEEGLYDKLSKSLLEQKINSFRFDFRFHGMSTGKNQYVTIAGETEDFLHSLELIIKKWELPIFVIATSFGAVSILNGYTDRLCNRIKGIIFLNPVFDLQMTFLNPEFNWPRDSFNKKAYEELENKGFFLLDNKLKVGKTLFNEIENLKPYKKLHLINSPVLLIHGNCDQYVSYNLVKKYSTEIQQCDFVTIDGANHGFEKKEEQDKVLQLVINWIKKFV